MDFQGCPYGKIWSREYSGKRQPERNAEDDQDSTRWRKLDARQRRLSSLGGKVKLSWLNAQCSEDNKFGQLGGYRVPETKSRCRTKKLAANEENGDESIENSIVFVNERCSNDFLEKAHVQCTLNSWRLFPLANKCTVHIANIEQLLLWFFSTCEIKRFW